jgi:hypothetical protein
MQMEGQYIGLGRWGGGWVAVVVAAAVAAAVVVESVPLLAEFVDARQSMVRALEWEEWMLHVDR